MTSLNSSLSRLVENIIPESRKNVKLKEELISQSQDILNSQIGNIRETDYYHLTDSIKRHLQTSQSSTTALRFTNLLSRLTEQPTLSRKHAVISFLHSLSSTSTSTLYGHAMLPPVAPPRPSRPHSTINMPHERDSASKKQTGRSKAEILRRYRAKIGKPHLSEDVILRDALYILQGISGKYVRLVDGESTEKESKLVFTDDSHHYISAPNCTLIHRLAELGHLYVRVAAFVREREGRGEIGMIEQSLCHYLETQLTEYYRLIAVLESQMQLSSSGVVGDEVNRAVDEETGLTLKRLEVWVDDWRLRLRMMSACVEGCRDVHGGGLVNLIHSYTENGDPFIRKFTDELLEEVSKPFFAMLRKWLFSGELYDPFSEFFVALDPELADMQYIQPSGLQGGILPTDDGLGAENDEFSSEHSGGLKIWEGKYVFRKEMLPAFVGEEFGRKIFSTGKSLNFIRYNCNDSDWVATREKLGNTSGTLQYSDISGLERSIDAAYSIASQRLFVIFFEKFKLLDHLKALKNYMFLGRGDFADFLMDTLGPSLSRPANTLYRHNLTTALETAIRSTNAHYDPPDVLRRLDARMMEYSHGEIGWDVFSLEYKVDAPIDTVLDSDTLINYLKVFRYLWKMKRVEGSLSTAWMRVAGGSRTFLRVPELEIEWHQIQLNLSEMIHFLRNLQAYCQLEVIECQWKKLMEFINNKEGDLDMLIASHRNYAGEIAKKITLYYPKSGKEDNLLNQVQEIFEIILQFRAAMDDFYNYTLAEAARQEGLKDKERGLFVDPRLEREQAAAKEALPRILRRTRDYGSAFSEKVQTIVLSLSIHPDLDCKYLGIRLSFSDFYKTKRESHAKT